MMMVRNEQRRRVQIIVYHITHACNLVRAGLRRPGGMGKQEVEVLRAHRDLHDRSKPWLGQLYRWACLSLRCFMVPCCCGANVPEVESCGVVQTPEGAVVSI